MHGPDGKNYPSESVFAELEPPKRFVVQHQSKPRYRLVIELLPLLAGTTVSWSQTFVDEKVAMAIEHIVVPANEQDLDRLVSELGRWENSGPTPA